MPKGKVVLSLWENTNALCEAVLYQSALCIEIRRNDIRSLTANIVFAEYRNILNRRINLNNPNNEAHNGYSILFDEIENLRAVDNASLHPLVDMNYLYEGLRRSMKGSSWKGEPQNFYLHFLNELNTLRMDLLKHEYKTSKGSTFKINERGHERIIHGAVTRDRVIRHVLCDFILEAELSQYLIYTNSASQKGKGVKFARTQFEKALHNYYLKYGTNEGYIGLVDLSKFYDNIRHDEIKKAMFPYLDDLSRELLTEVLRNFEVDMSHLSDEDFAVCMDKKFNSLDYNVETKGIAKNGEKMMPKSVDIGDQVSQNIGIFFPTPIDNYVKIVRGCKWYGRYMDDMYIICQTKEEVQSIIAGICDQANKLGMFVNEKKTRICKLSDKFQFLQVKYFLTESGRVVRRINPKSMTRERRKLKRYKRLMDKGGIAYEDVKQAYKTWMGSFAYLMSKKQRSNMRKLFFDLFQEDVRWKK